jgi:RNA polymerase sigma-B factor
VAKRNLELKLTPDQQVLAAANLNLARNIAWKYHRSTSIEYSILESAAFEGLCQAAAKYDAGVLHKETGKSLKFSSLAVPYIRGSILHYIRDRTYSMRLTHRMRELWVKGRKKLNLGFSDIEIANELGISLGEWQDTKSACSGPPLELKDQAKPIDGLEPDEVDHLTQFREEASETISRLPDSFRKRLERYALSRSIDVPPVIAKDLEEHLGVC